VPLPPVPPDLPQVVVEIAPPESAPELKSALLDACTKAAQGAMCVEAGTAQEDAPGVVAIVSWQGASHVRLQVALRREQEWVAREITFDEHDVPEERWRAVGLMIGTLGSVIARGETPLPETPAEPAPAAPSEPKPVSTVPERQIPSPSPPSPPSPRHGAITIELPGPHRAFIGMAAVSGSAFEQGAPRLGGEIGGSALISRAGLYSSAAFSYQEGLARAHGVRTTWIEASLGLGFARELGSAFVGVMRADGFCERFAPLVAIPDTPGPTTDDRWLGGARLGADLMWWGLEPIALLIGGAARWTAGTTDVRFDGTSIGTTPAFGYFVRAGIAHGFR
jgi:hypothetical protein